MSPALMDQLAIGPEVTAKVPGRLADRRAPCAVLVLQRHSQAALLQTLLQLPGRRGPLGNALALANGHDALTT